MGTVLVDIVVYIAVGLFVSLFARQYDFNPILGYIIAGFFLGPHGFDVISLEDWSHSAGEYGVAFLLFTMGLSVTWNKLWELRFYALVIGSLQVLLCLFVFASVMYALGASVITACLVGSLFAFSSTAVIGQILSERNEFSSEHGRVNIAILLFQDFAVLFVLVLVTMNGGEDSELLTVILKAFSKAIMILLACATLWRFLLRPLYRWVGSMRSSDLLVSMMLLIILLLSLLTEMAGLSAELGAFLAGMLLGDTEYQTQVDVDIKPFKHLLLGLFFITIGMRMQVDVFIGYTGLIFALLIGFMMLKFSIIYGLLHFLGRTANDIAIRAACVLASGSEFSILALQRGQESSLFTGRLSEILSLVFILSLALTPLLSRLSRLWAAARILKDKHSDGAQEIRSITGQRDHVVIAGVGAVGITVIRAIEGLNLPYIAIDNNAKRVKELKGGEREGVFLGDVCKIDTLKKARIEHAKVLVVCMEHFKSCERAMSVMHRHYPHVDMVVRIKRVEHVALVKQYGGTPIAMDAFVLGRDIVGHIMRGYAFSPDRIEHTLQGMRVVE